LLQCPLVLAGALLIEWKLKLDTDQQQQKQQQQQQQAGGGGDLRQKLKRIDFQGAFFLCLTILGALGVLDLGGQKLPWSHPVIVGLGCTAVVCSVGFTLTERYCAAEPIFPLRLMAHYVVCTSYLMLTLQNLAIMEVSGGVYLLPHLPPPISFSWGELSNGN
jgi:hypothetical protein